jgi:hypothetical protein
MTQTTERLGECDNGSRGAGPYCCVVSELGANATSYLPVAASQPPILPS